MRTNEILLEKVVGGQDAAIRETTEQVPGMKCPQCGEFIPITLQQITTDTAIVCPHCNLKMNIDRTNTGKAIDALRKVKAAKERLEK